MINRTIEQDSIILVDSKGNKLLIKEKINPKSAYISFEGDVSYDLSHDFEDEIMTAVSVSDSIYLDFSKTNSISTYALSSLVEIQQVIEKHHHKKLRIMHISEKIINYFKETGIMDVFVLGEHDE